MPKVSVIIPTHNRPGLVIEALNSVLRQTYTDYEVIVVDDDSADETHEALRPLVAGGKIRYVNRGKLGVMIARNTGAELARGSYLAFLDDDDLWPEEKLEWQVECMERNPDAAMVYGMAKSFVGHFTDEAKNRPIIPQSFPSGDCHEAFLSRNFITSPGQTLIRKASFEKAGAFDRDIQVGVEDYDLFIRLAAVGEFIYRQRAALYYRKHSGGKRLTDRVWRMYRGHCSIRSKYLGTLPNRKTARLWWRNFVFWQKNFSKNFISVAKANFADRRFCRGLAGLFMSVWLWPPNLIRLRFYRSVKSALALWVRGS